MRVIMMMTVTVMMRMKKVNGEWTAFTQHFSNQWPLKALYNIAQHSPIPFMH